MNSQLRKFNDDKFVSLLKVSKPEIWNDMLIIIIQIWQEYVLDGNSLYYKL